MNSDYRVLVIILVNFLLYYFINQVDAILSIWAIHLTLDSLYLLFAALYLRGAAAFSVVAITAMAIEATLPFTPGSHLICYIFSFLLLDRTRVRLSRENPYQVVALALTMNLVIFLCFTASAEGLPLAVTSTWLRLFSDLFLSQLVVALLANLLVNRQRYLLLLAGIDIATEPQSL